MIPISEPAFGERRVILVDRSAGKSHISGQKAVLGTSFEHQKLQASFAVTSGDHRGGKAQRIGHGRIVPERST
jgi:hypothetical protein